MRKANDLIDLLMLRFVFVLTILAFTIAGAYHAAQSKMSSKLDLSALKLGMTVDDVGELFGAPTSKIRNIHTYILPDSSVLTVTFRDDVATSAKVKYLRPVKVSDPELRKLTLVQMDPAITEERPSWFFAGAPEQGLIYKITAGGVIESLTWVKPFTLSARNPKNVQALLRDFNSHQLSNL